ncbi:MAG: Octaprenyl diphosphate synthase [Elusimicrobia bacterium]|nr:Octaprenyl diphosphate synthase [Elusimicrobiota bacterium]
MNIFVTRDLKEALKPDLNRLNQILETMADETGGFLGDLKSYVLVGSGKRVRPALVILSSMLGKSLQSEVQTVGLAVELIHIATLVHDDVIDKAAMRRNRKTVANEHGVDAAVLLGDHIFTHAFEKVAELNRPSILRLLARSTSVMCAGEIDQLKKRFHFDLSEEEYFSFLEKKTASLFGASARSGAILADQSESIQLALEQFGLHLGLAFQITDDLLDLTGEESVVGKTLRTDLMNGKMTLPLIYFRDHLSSDKTSKEFFENLNHPNGHLLDLVDQMKTSGAIQYAEDIAKKNIQLALNQLEKLPKGLVRDLLSALANMLQVRTA